MDVRDALKAATAAAGSQTALGQEIGYTQNAIWCAARSNRVSPVMARRLDDYSGGAISKHQLRPDAFGEAATVPPLNFTATRTHDGTVVVVDRDTGTVVSGPSLAEAVAELRRMLAGRRAA